jgi:hypothetical protein
MMEPAEITRRAREAAKGIRDFGRRAVENPLPAILSALAAGFLFGLVLRLFERTPREPGEK